MRMDARKQDILLAIITDYIATAEPVGSRTIARKYRLGISPATIRNEMADLEEQGYVEQPHASAGRVPSDKGYRFYVDELMQVRPLPEAVLARVRELTESRVKALEVVLQQAARLLSAATHSLAVLVGPQVKRMVFRHLDLVPLAADRALLVVVADVGFLESGIIEVPPELTQQELAYVAQVLTRALQGKTLQGASRAVLRELQVELYRYRHILEQALEFLAAVESEETSERFYLVGVTCLLSEPEFSDRHRLRAVLSVVEQEEMMRMLLSTRVEESVAVTIGEENPVREGRDLSVVLAPYRVGNTVGRLAVVGPRRMDYGRAVGAVSEFEKVLSEMLGGWGSV